METFLVYPAFKSGNRSKSQKSSPVALLSVVSKVMESLISDVCSPSLSTAMCRKHHTCLEDADSAKQSPLNLRVGTAGLLIEKSTSTQIYWAPPKPSTG